MITHRFNGYKEWYKSSKGNAFFYGFINMLNDIIHRLDHNSKMIEIGSHMGESTMLFASTQLFSEVHALEPFDGDEEFNYLFDYEWDYIESEFRTNTRIHKDIITLHKGYSWELVDKFEDNSMDLIYIDGQHTKQDVTRDLKLYLPKLKKGGIIAGHDYHEVWPGVKDAVNKLVGGPEMVYEDTSWWAYN